MRRSAPIIALLFFLILFSRAVAEEEALLAPEEDDGRFVVEARTRYTIDDFGIVAVVDSWSGLAEESGTYLYMSATRELGGIPVRVKDHRFSINFATRSYLIEDEEDPSTVYFRTPMFIYEKGAMSLEITLHLPSRLVFVEMAGSAPEPDSIEGSTLKWVIPEGEGTTLMVKLKREMPFLVPGEGGPQFDPLKLPNLSSGEIPRNADQVLRELETIIMVAEYEGTTDPDFIKLLRKSLSKLYYLFYLYGLVTDFEPGGIGED